MVARKYSKEVADVQHISKSQGSYIRVHFKNTFEVAAQLKNMPLLKALSYLKDVKEHKQCVPFRRYAGGIGRTAQAKQFGTTRGRWPEKSCTIMQGLLENAKANAEVRRKICVI